MTFHIVLSWEPDSDSFTQVTLVEDNRVLGLTSLTPTDTLRVGPRSLDVLSQTKTSFRLSQSGLQKIRHIAGRTST